MSGYARSALPVTALGLALASVVPAGSPMAAEEAAETTRLKVEISRFAAGLNDGLPAPQVTLSVLRDGVAEQTARSVSEGEQVRLGSYLKLCFTVPQSGFVAVWGRDAAARPVRIYPNRYTPDAETRQGMPVDAGETCIGDDDRFRLKLTGDPGPNAVYLHWTKIEAAQPIPEDYDDIDALSADVEATQFRGTWFRFEAVP